MRRISKKTKLMAVHFKMNKGFLKILCECIKKEPTNMGWFVTEVNVEFLDKNYKKLSTNKIKVGFQLDDFGYGTKKFCFSKLSPIKFEKNGFSEWCRFKFDFKNFSEKVGKVKLSFFGFNRGF